MSAMITKDMFELGAEEIEMVGGAKPLGSVSSDAVFGAGVAISALALGADASVIGLPAGIALGFLGGLMIGYGLS